MMKKLQSHTDSSVQYLINSVKHLKISSFEGENVSRVVSLIRGANKRLRNVTVLPEEFPKWVLLVFQTSSVEDFNKVFGHLRREIEVVTPLINNTRVRYPSIEDMLRMAEKLYLDMTASNEWSGATTKANQAAFLVNGQGTPNVARKLSCWNCGMEGHTLKECPRPSNPTLVEKNKQAFKIAKAAKQDKAKKEGKGNNTNGKWAPPTANENNRRVVDGIARFWLTKTKRWVKDKKLAGTPAIAAVAVAPSTVSTVPSTVTTGSDTSVAGKELAVANAAHSIQLAMQGLLSTFKES
jgi:hypothetical protein